MSLLTFYSRLQKMAGGILHYVCPLQSAHCFEAMGEAVSKKRVVMFCCSSLVN
jgi:hypothetical protein